MDRIKPGTMVVRLSAVRDGQPWECLYLYDTASYHTEDWLKSQGVEVKRERIAWDGKGYVSQDNGD